jgi:tetraacyldisaccharide 4'-kinase
VFPRGALREPADSLRRAEVVVLSRRDLIDQTAREAVRARALELAPQATWVEVSHRPLALRSSLGHETGFEALQDLPLAAFCGIGNPPAFRRTLEECRFRLLGFEAFPDHHRYRREDLDRLGRWAARLGAQCLVCTHKDLVKIGLSRLGTMPLWALRVGIAVERGLAELESRLERVLPREA